MEAKYESALKRVSISQHMLFEQIDVNDKSFWRILDDGNRTFGSNSKKECMVVGTDLFSFNGPIDPICEDFIKSGAVIGKNRRSFLNNVIGEELWQYHESHDRRCDTLSFIAAPANFENPTNQNVYVRISVNNNNFDRQIGVLNESYEMIPLPEIIKKPRSFMETDSGYLSVVQEDGTTAALDLNDNEIHRYVLYTDNGNTLTFRVIVEDKEYSFSCPRKFENGEIKIDQLAGEINGHPVSIDVSNDKTIDEFLNTIEVAINEFGPKGTCLLKRKKSDGKIVELINN